MRFLMAMYMSWLNSVGTSSRENRIPPRVDRVCWEAMVCRVWKYGSWMGVVFFHNDDRASLPSPW